MAIIATLNESESAENTVSNEIIDTDDNCQSQVPPVAIVGLGMRLPGAIHTAEQLWKTLVQKRSTRCEIPASRFSVDGFHSPSAKPGSVAMRHGHFLDDSDDLHHLDTSLFSMGITEVKDIDPQQRMLLEVVYECMESSGQVNWQGSNIGCYVGVWGEDWLDLHAKDLFDAGTYRVSGSHDFAISNRISYEYNLKGPSYTIKAGCSSSLIALHEAVRAIRAGDCDGAIVAGTNLIFSPTMSMAMTEQGVLSPDASCKSFDANANGYARGEAINAIFLKGLSSALRNGDPIRAVVRATSSNSDGKTPGMSMPSSESHMTLIQHAYHEAGLNPKDTVFVEAHGTGTPVGDPLEAIAISRVFGGRKERPFYLGSVKPNLGHSEGASGISSVLKVVLALENRKIPPNINFSIPNPKIPFNEANMVVPCEVLPWPENQPLRASVNSFGIGGANAHCIIESIDQFLSDNPVQKGISDPHLGIRKTTRIDDRKPTNASNGTRFTNGVHGAKILDIKKGHTDLRCSLANKFLSDDFNGLKSNREAGASDTTGHGLHTPRKVLYAISAASPASLKMRVLEHQKYQQQNKKNQLDVSYTLCNRREHLSHRAYSVVSTISLEGESQPALEFSSPAKVANAKVDVNMVFTGQGAQWAGMASELLQDYSLFRDTISYLGRVLSQLEHSPTWDLTEELRKPEATSRIGEAEFSQPLVCAVQLALVDLLRDWCLLPTAVVGHSSGEIAAAYAAGAITSAEAITIAYYRGYVNKGIKKSGGMAAVGLGAQQVIPYLADGVVVACDNSPQSITISGDKDVLQDVCRVIKEKEPDALVRLLKVPVAYHSHHMHDLGDSFESLLKGKLHSKVPVIPFFSSVKSKQLQEPGSLNAAYWRENLENPVLFTDAVSLLLKTQSSSSRSVFIEIGPHSALAGPLRQIFKAHGTGQQAYATALTRGKDSAESVLKLAGELFVQGVPMNLSRISPMGNVVTDLPLYPWNHEKEFWAESRISKEWRFRKYPQHELLGSKTLESSKFQPAWRNVLRLEAVPWLRDHQVLNDVIFPCAGYLSMAVEAVRQATESTEVDGFILKNVIVRSALVMTDSKPIELLTTLQPVRLTNTLDSNWWEFSIMSHNGSNWMKHCDGQVRTNRDADQFKEATSQHLSTINNEAYPRTVNDLYPQLHRLGLRYGPCFRGLEDVKCQPNGKRAMATLSKMAISESSYAIHPATIDHCLQLFFPASCEGIFYRAEKLCVPTVIGNLYLADGKATEVEGSQIEASSSLTSGGTISGNAKVFSKKNGAVLLQLEGGKFSPIESTEPNDSNSESIAAAQLTWKSHLDLADMESLIRPNPALINDNHDLDLVEKLTLLSIFVVKERMESIPSPPHLEHMGMFRKWIHDQAARLIKDHSKLQPEARKIISLEPSARLSLLVELRQEIMKSGAASAAVLIGRIIDRCEDLLRGSIDGIEVLQADNGLTDYYNYVESRTDSVDFFVAAGHTRPTLRVLEIGAGTGGSTQVILEGLMSKNGVDRLYSTYAYTDISAGFFVNARERFKAYPALDFRVLDITKDPVEQGFEAASFDLIIAGNVLHATPSLSETLANVRKLLAPEGYLFLQELSPKMQMVNFIMGILPGWWLGAGEGRYTEPYLTPEKWDAVLKQAGFSGTDAAIYDAPSPYHINANIISRPARSSQVHNTIDDSSINNVGQDNKRPRVTLLYRLCDEDCERVVRLRSSIEEKGFRTILRSIEQHQEIKSDDQELLVSLLDIRKPFLESISEANLTALQAIVSSLGSTPMLWIMPPAQRNVGRDGNPSFGLSLGLLRTLRNERSVAITTLEMDRMDDAGFAAATKLMEKLAHERGQSIRGLKETSVMDPDREFFFTKGALEVGRYHPVTLSQDLALKSQKSGAATLQIGRPGLLQSLKWIDLITPNPAHNEIVVEPRCVGLNFRDVLLCMGIVEANDVSIGLEGSGIVTKVGSGVTGLQPGDRVFYLADKCFSTELTVLADRCAKIPSSLPFEQAATMPCVYATVIHSLLDMGGLKSGMSILIHSACGGIGIAALNICQNIQGLEVYATVGSEVKIEYLMQNFGLKREQIFNSRDTSFLHDVRVATKGRGVDLVLNSLSGELLHASWQCVAPYGKMLEIGKRDFIGKARLDMDLFEANRSFIGIDLARFDATRCQRLLQRTVDMLTTGSIRPIEPIKVFDATEVEASFRYMQKGTHLGKVVVSIPEKGMGLPKTLQTPYVGLNPSATYMLVGGLGGLGRAVATWMVERGARHLMFLSRSAGQSTNDQAFFWELQCQGCTAQAVQGDVTDIADVERAMASALPGKPIRGILQMSMVLCDKAFADMDLEDWQTTVKAKVEGTWNLHRAAPQDLDFLFVTGSISGSFGMPGQANYAAGNTYLTAFTQHRQALGLPASVLHVGLMEDIGYLAQNPTRAEALRAAGGFFLRTRQLLEGINWALTPSAGKPDHLNHQLTIGLRCEKPLLDPANRVIWKKDSRMGLYHNHNASNITAGGPEDNETDALRLFMGSIDAEPGLLDEQGSLDFVTRIIGTRVYTFMLHPLEDMDLTASLTSLGVDSLVTIELRNWIKRSFGGLEFSTLEILDARTIDGLGRLTIDALKTRLGKVGVDQKGDAYLDMKAP